jgi:hypothetical protein
MNEIFTSVLFVLVVVVFVILLPLWWLARLRRTRLTKHERARAEQKAKFEHRQLHPDYAAFTSHYGCEPPSVLRQLYEDREMVLDGEFEIRLPPRKTWFVAWFEPMEEGSWVDVDGFYSFANDGSGNLYLVRPQEADPEVFFLDHETGKREGLGVRLSEFLAAKRIR